jgi:hypothetical protein
MSHTHSRTLLACVALALTSGCSPEGFDVTPCSLDGELAFRVHPIDGWLTDYRPRPSAVLVSERYDGNDFEKAAAAQKWPGLWAAELKDVGEQGAFQTRPFQNLIVHGQRLPLWEIAQAAKPLTRGKHYVASIKDGGRDGYASFVAGGLLPACS